VSKTSKENENLIAYCGLYCGDCYNHKGVIADLARDLRKELRAANFEQSAEFLSAIPFFKEFKNYKECYAVLGAMVRLRCHKTCKSGGGPPFCKIRKCCQLKAFKGCWECGEFEVCKNLDFLRVSHGTAHLKNLAAIKKKGVKAFVQGKRLWFSK
jgi:hypothetical protein